MRAEQARIHELAEFLDIPISTQICGNQLEIEFKNWHDSAELRLNAFSVDVGHESHLHTEEFVPGQEEYQRRWVAAAQDQLNHLGIAYRIERHGHEVEFSFDHAAEHAVFVDLRDRGVFHARARTTSMQPSLK